MLIKKLKINLSQKVFLAVIVILVSYPSSYILLRLSKVIVHHISVMNGTYYSHEVAPRHTNIGGLSFLTAIYSPLCDYETSYWIQKQPLRSNLTDKHLKNFNQYMKR